MKKTLVLEYTTGSRMFGLETPESDYDLLQVHLDPEKAIDPSAKTTTVFKKDGNIEGIDIELATFMRGLMVHDLKYIEAIHVPPTFKHPWLDLGPLVEYAQDLDLHEMYLREILRRYNKAWYKEINPQSKNYNVEQGYDSKYAAHLVRVLTAAAHYLRERSVMTDFSEHKTLILGVRSGDITKDEAFELTTSMKNDVFEELDTKAKLYFNDPSEPKFPARWYFNQVYEFYS